MEASEKAVVGTNRKVHLRETALGIGRYGKGDRLFLKLEFRKFTGNTKTSLFVSEEGSTYQETGQGGRASAGASSHGQLTGTAVITEICLAAASY